MWEYYRPPRVEYLGRESYRGEIIPQIVDVEHRESFNGVGFFVVVLLCSS